MTRKHDPCAFCERFTLPTDGAPTSWCTASKRVTPWNGQIGVLFKESRDRAPRARYAAQQANIEKQKETA